MSAHPRPTLPPPRAALRQLLGVPAPAKLNWFLHVLGRRADGMHQLQTVFQFIDWCDRLDLERLEDGRIERDGGDGLPADDLCVCAARLLQQHCGCRLGVRMRLRKHIPVQAGLGGGSSDAASVLLALNHLWGLGLRRSELQQLGLRLGADVPVFLFGRSAFAEGIGEHLRPLPLPRARVVVGWPGRGLSTAEVFGHPSLTRDTPACTMEGFCEHLKNGVGESGVSVAARLLRFGGNDLQAPALHLLPRLRDMQRWLERVSAGPVRMSGSGSAMFAPWPDAAAEPSPQGCDADWKVRVVWALEQHPLLHWVED